MFVFLKKLFPKKSPAPQFSDSEYERYYEAKCAALKRVLGEMHDIVNHALIPFAIGGALDMYYFPNVLPGTGMATMELIEPDGSGPKPNLIGTYELVAFTRRKLRLGQDVPDDDPFAKTHRRLYRILNGIARYSYEAVLNPGETCEFPAEEDAEPACLVLDNYAPLGNAFEINGKKHCLLLVIEITRSEMEYAMEHGSEALLNKLKAKGHYPYSDLDREPVV
jgi:hypothetical protein